MAAARHSRRPPTNGAGGWRTMPIEKEQMDLFGSRYPERPGFVRGCDTSADAADSLDDGILTRLRAKVFAVIDARGERGATCDEIEQALGLRHQTAGARIRELVLGGFVADTGKRRTTRSGRPARIYRPALVEDEKNAD